MKIKDFFINIFSITDSSELRIELRILGIKIKLPKKAIADMRKQNPYYYYKKHNLDITTLPPATGRLRELQLANLALLKELDYVCKQNGLEYWLDFGTLIGAIRHKGFIPWDDDIDVSMMREDYEKIIDTFKKSSRNPDILAVFCKNDEGCFIKVKHRLCSKLFVDIFPWDKYGKRLSDDEQPKKTQEIRTIRAQAKIFEIEDAEALKNKLNDFILNQIIVKDNEPKGDFIWGADFNHSWKNWFTHYEYLYPLKTIEYEGIEFPCPNNIDAILTKIYGNYMDYPSKMRLGHSMFLNFTEQEKNIVKELGKSVKEPEKILK